MRTVPTPPPLPPKISLDQATKVIQYLELARSLNAHSSYDSFRTANILSWELALCLPTELYRLLARALTHPDDTANPLIVIATMREALRGCHDLEAEDILVHAPGIGKERHR